MDKVFNGGLSGKTDDEIVQYREEIISDYISSEKVNWNNKKFVLEQQKYIEKMINSAPDSDTALSLLLSELTDKLALLHNSLTQLQQIQGKQLEQQERDDVR